MNTALQTLNLGSNSVGQGGARAIAEALRVNHIPTVVSQDAHDQMRFVTHGWLFGHLQLGLTYQDQLLSQRPFLALLGIT